MITTPVANKKILGPFTLAMIAIVAIIDLRAMPMMANYGFGVVFVYGLAMLLFLIPSGLVCAELSTSINASGGVYTWLRQAFGERTGFMAIWLEWLNNVVGFPTSISFIVITFVHVVHPAWSHNKFIVFGLTLVILWSMTLFTLFGLKLSSRLSILGAILGTIIPAIIIMSLGLTWLLLGKPLQIEFSWQNLIPPLNASNPGFFGAIILGFGGMQIIGFHNQNAKNPQRDYPRAILIAISIIFMVTLCSALAIAMIVPHTELNIVSGLLDGFDRFFRAFHLSWATPVVMLLIIFSALATLNAWFLGPARGLLVAAEKGYFPKIFTYTNRYDMPAAILILQACACTLLTTMFLIMPSINSGFWVLLNLASQSALMVYSMIFAAALKRRYQQRAKVAGSYTIPGGNWGIWLAAGTGMVTCLGGLLFSVIPPTNVNIGGVFRYDMILLVSNAIFLSVPFIIMALQAKNLMALNLNPDQLLADEG